MHVCFRSLFSLVLSVTPLSAFADPCGDVDVDLDVDAADVLAFRQSIADPTGAALSPAGEANCTVFGAPGPCDLIQVVVLRRDLNAPSMAPGISPLCASSLAACDVLNAAGCLLPWPSMHYTTPAATPTGIKLALSDAGMPSLTVGPPVPATMFNELDGFSPMVQMLMHFPQGVDLVASNASRLLTAQAPGPPWENSSRTYDGSSLDPNSPSVLIDADTGERILHFLEPDARADGNPARQALILRPGKSLTPGHRYIVAMRNLSATGGGAVVAEAPFAALRDQVVTGNPAIDGRSAYFEASIFPPLVADGITRSELVLAWDFVVQSEHQLTHQMLTMRDDGYSYVADIVADPNQVPFTVTSVSENPGCLTDPNVVWKLVQGTFQAPNYLTSPPAFNVPQHNVDANDVPVRNGTYNEVFSISIPCTVLDPAKPSRPMILGHGLFGTGLSMTSGIPQGIGSVAEWNYLAGATDFRGLTSVDLNWIATIVGANQLLEFESFPDRLRQGMSNTLVLSRMMEEGIFNRDPEFQTGGQGVFPGPSEESFYYGISLGGVMGTFMAALSPDIERYGLDVPAVNFSCLLQRSTQFTTFEDLLTGIGFDDPMETVLGIGLLHELWVSAEPAGYVRHITSDPLPGSGSASKVLYTPAWLDKQVSNVCTEIAARSMNLVTHEDSIWRDLEGIPNTTGPQDSAMVMFDTGAFDLFDPNYDPFIPPLANQIPSDVCDPHGDRPTIEAGVQMLVDFLQPGGQIEHKCNGICDAEFGQSPDEQPLGGLCDPLP